MKNVKIRSLLALILIGLIVSIGLMWSGKTSNVAGEYTGKIELDMSKLEDKPFAKMLSKYVLEDIVLEYHFNKNRTGSHYVEAMGKKRTVPFVWDFVDDNNTIKIILSSGDILILTYENDVWSDYSDVIGGTIILTKL